MGGLFQSLKNDFRFLNGIFLSRFWSKCLKWGKELISIPKISLGVSTAVWTFSQKHSYGRWGSPLVAIHLLMQLGEHCYQFLPPTCQWWLDIAALWLKVSKQCGSRHRLLLLSVLLLLLKRLLFHSSNTNVCYSLDTLAFEITSCFEADC